MAQIASLRLEGQAQGEIRGSVSTRGREGSIAVLESNHELAVPIDAGTGLPSGRAQHRPFVVVKEIDAATPALYRALLQQEVMGRFELTYWARSRTASGRAGRSVARYTVRLQDARLMGIRFVHPDALDPALADFPEAEELSFVYSSVEWVWTDPADSVSAGWAPPSSRPKRRTTD